MKSTVTILFLLFFLATTSLQAQDKTESIHSDSIKMERYLELANNSLLVNSNLAIGYANKAKNLAINSNLKKHKVYHFLSNLYFSMSDYKKSTYYSFMLLRETKKLKGNLRFDYEGRAYEQLANINEKNGNLQLSIRYQIKAIELYKKIKNDNYYIVAHINLANYYTNENDIKSALKYYWFVESKLESEHLDKYASFVFNGIAVCYDYQAKVEKKNKNDKNAQALYKKSLEYYEKSKNAILLYTPNDISSLAVAYNNIGTLQNEHEDYQSAIENLEKSLNLFLKVHDRGSILDVYYNLALLNSNVKNFKESNQNLWSHMALKDSIFDDETKQMIHDLSIKYQSEKKEQENKILSQENENKQLTIYFSLAGIVLITIMLTIIFRSNRLKEKANKILEEKREIIERYSMKLQIQHSLLEIKTTEITDSIKYAKRIQRAILPPNQKWYNILPNSFILYQPKDILSGDFYWIAESESQILVAAADCTGHGVPGALISIVNFNLLNKAVLEKGINSPNKILDTVNYWLTETLNQKYSESQIKDGMDIGLISIDKVTNECFYSGANSPLYLFNGEELLEFKANKFPVGGYIHDEIKHFSQTKIPVKKGDTIYLFSDGFADQFGGAKNKKFKYHAFRELLLKANNLPVSDRKEFLISSFNDWKGLNEQTDDVLIIGIQI